MFSDHIKIIFMEKTDRDFLNIFGSLYASIDTSKS